MSLTPGTRIGAFEIVDKLGEGGMGEVYRARDTKLDRDVALKVLPALFVSDPDRVARFEREAKVLASLNHPNIAQVYDFERPSAASGQAAIAMELVEGATLDEVIRASGPMPLDRALAIVRQIAAALDAAHERGIIHRDLKPANVNVREDGTVKVLDFGLAKAFAADAEAANAELANSPTLTARSTQLGMIIGTAAYMSPEQAKGRAVDRRADVWAFGAVFFEMLAGRRAFDGEDVSDVLASVLKTDPDWNLLPAELPGPVRRLLRRCLEKDPKKRLRDVSEGMLQLDEGLASGSTASMMTPADRASTFSGASPAPLWRRVLPLAATAAATALIVTAIGFWRAAPPPSGAATRFLHVPPNSDPLFSTTAYRDVAIAPDGRAIAYVSGQGPLSASIHLRKLDQLEGAPVRGARSAVFPFFSPDGQWIGFIDSADQTQIKKVGVLGGPAVPMTKLKTQVVGATWASDGAIVAGSLGPLFTVSASGGEATPLTTLDTASGETFHHWPSAIPDTTVVLFVVLTGGRGGLDGQLAAVDRASGRVARLKIPGLHPQYLATGHIVYASPDGSLSAVGFDPERLTVTGNPVPVLEGVGVKASGAANFAISTEGHLVHTAAGAGAAARTITWVDRTGRETPIAAPTRNYFYARISPDGSRLSLDVRDEDEDIWIWDLRRETLARLTDRAGSDQYGLWTPDHRVIFSSPTSGRAELFRHRPDGVGRPEQITDTTADPLVAFPNAITPDGKQVIFRAAVKGKNDLFVVDMGGDKKPRTLLSTEHDERNAALSPDGAYMVFESDLSGGRFEIFVRPFPNVDGAQIKVSTEGGAEPVWSRDGREIFYVAADKLMAVPVTIRPGGLELGKPAVLFDVSPYFFGGLGRNYDVAGDGRRFVMVKDPAGDFNSSRPVTVVLNWIDELRGRLK
jgi:serine/threonine-protein kinase